MDSKIIKHFKKADPVLYKLIQRVGESKITLAPRPPSQYFRSLCSTIISQQLSGKVADLFWTRFLDLFPGHKITPRKVLGISNSQLREIGISGFKAIYLKSLAEYFSKPNTRLSLLASLPHEEVISELTQIKGVGRWTAEMFLMFTLGRPDVFSAGDQGLKNALKKHYPSPPDPIIWSPYSTYACLVLWQSLELTS